MATVATDAQRIMGQVTAMAMLDDEFRARLEATPIEVLREFGMDLSDSVRVEIVSDAAKLDATGGEDTIQFYVPEAADLSEEELSMVAGAVASCETTASSCCTFTCLSSASSWSSNSCT
jgi:hypothetical protein